jgi:biopolymer transport protein TolR
MRLGEPGRVQSAINVTPLVDVVLVLLIIFMVVAPQMLQGPEVDLPDTAKPGEQGEGPNRILVTINGRGELWIDDQQVATESFGEALRAAAGAQPDRKVVIRGDARLRFGDVRQAMVAIDGAGFHGLGLIAERAGKQARGD